MALPNNMGFPTKCRNLLGANHTNFMKNLTPKTILHINMIALHLINNNLTLALSNITSLTTLLDTAGTTNIAYPLPLLNLMIYYYLASGNIYIYINININLFLKEHPSMALEIIKRRRLLTSLTNKPLLKITK